LMMGLVQQMPGALSPPPGQKKTAELYLQPCSRPPFDGNHLVETTHGEESLADQGNVFGRIPETSIDHVKAAVHFGHQDMDNKRARSAEHAQVRQWL